MSSDKMTSSKGNFINIDDHLIYYEKIGDGPNNVLLLPGVLGCAKLDFQHQLKNLDPSKFTLIAMDLPGYGFSRPHDKTYTDNWYLSDAKTAIRLMEQLNITSYSVIGFSDGGRTAIWMAANSPDTVEKVVVWGCSSSLDENERKRLQLARSVSNWPKQRRQAYEKIYQDKLQRLWGSWIDGLTKSDVLIPDEVLESVACPTLIIHGAKDAIIGVKHAYHLKRLLKRSSFYSIRNAPHHCHETNWKEFNNSVGNFLLK